MNKKGIFSIFFIFFLYKFINKKIGEFFKKKLINFVVGEFDFSSNFVLFETIIRGNGTKKIKNSRGFFIINGDGIYYITNFFNPKIEFISFKNIKKVELTQRIEDISLLSRALHIYQKDKTELYFLLIKGNVREAFELIKKTNKTFLKN